MRGAKVSCDAVLDSDRLGTVFDAGIMKTEDLPHQKACAQWSDRILLLSLLGIAYLTLFPFHFDFSPTLVFHRYPFLLDTSVKKPHLMDFSLNVLLFVPFGFGVSARARKRGGGWRISLLQALAMGACVSYMVELLQFYVPARDSGWGDVFSNSLGSVLGGVLFALCGGAFLEEISKWENAFEGWLSPIRAALLIAAYFALCFGVSYGLQSETRLSNWDPRCILLVGNDASGQNPWKGQVFRLQIWNRALPDREILQIIGQESADVESTGLLGSYDFTSAPPYRDKTDFLPPLNWTPEKPQLENGRAPEWNSKSWLSTGIAVENLTREIKKSNQFTIHIVCAPAAEEEVNGRILTFSQSAGNVNFLLREQGQFLVFRLRNPLSEKRSLLAWYVVSAFQPGKVRDIVASYDGSDAFLYLDGNPVEQPYRLSPGASLMHKFFFIEIGALEGYNLAYETLIFLPAGWLVGIAIWKWSGKKMIMVRMLALGWAIPAVLFEFFLAAISGRRIWAGNILFSLVFGLAGMLLINADRKSTKFPPDL
jgi:glycopeptide antibiotics resistance protein